MRRRWSIEGARNICRCDPACAHPGICAVSSMVEQQVTVAATPVVGSRSPCREAPTIVPPLNLYERKSGSGVRYCNAVSFPWFESRTARHFKSHVSARISRCMASRFGAGSAPETVLRLRDIQNRSERLPNLALSSNRSGHQTLNLKTPVQSRSGLPFRLVRLFG